MATTYKSIYKRFNGTDWDTHYFKTSADVIVETTTYKVMTASERTAISTYLTSGFNGANQLLQLDASGLIDEGLIPGGLGYLPLAGGTMTGNITMDTGTKVYSAGVLTLDGDTSVSISGDEAGIVVGVSGISFSGGTGDVIDANGLKITDLGSPSATTDAATKQYVDDLVSVGARPAPDGPVKAATTGNFTFPTTLPTTVDGYTVQLGDRILVKSQTTASENGIYTVGGTVGAATWTKDTNDSVQGIMVFVENGTTYNDWIFYNSDGTTWSQFSKVDTIQAGSGLTKTGTTLSIESGDVTNDMLAGSIAWSKLANTGSLDNETSWGTEIVNASTSKSLGDHLGDIYSAIKKVRGTASYNTNNTQTVAGAYTLAASKNQTFIGASAPSTSGYTEGDLYFETIA